MVISISYDASIHLPFLVHTHPAGAQLPDVEPPVEKRPLASCRGSGDSIPLWSDSVLPDGRHKELDTGVKGSLGGIGGDGFQTRKASPVA